MATLVLPQKTLFSFKTMIALALCTASCGVTYSQTRERARVEQSVSPLVKVSEERGRVEAQRQLQRMVLVLAPGARQEDAAKQFVDELHNRNSTHFQHWLTAEEYGARFGATSSDLQKAKAWLERSGFRVDRLAKSGGWLEFSGTALQVESAFQTELHYYRVNGKALLANATEISLPAEVAEITPGVLSLNGFGKRPPRREAAGFAGRDANGQKLRLTPNLTAAGATNTFYVAPGDFASIYNTRGLQNGGIDGTGITIAVTAQSGIELTDVQMFRRIFGLKTNDPNIVVSGPDPGIAPGTDAEEAMLDAEWAGAVAPGATVTIVIAGSTDTTSGVDLAAAYAIDNRIAPILTYTYGSCEQALGPAGNAFYNALWRQAAAEGITVVVAAGDNGSAGCDNPSAGVPAANGLAVNGVAATPYNLAVGGTEFDDSGKESTFWSANNAADYSSVVGYIPEAAWNDGCDPSQAASATNCAFANGNLSLLASGGGASGVYAKPPWQTGPGVLADGRRDLPDVSLAASSNHDNAVYCMSLSGAACQMNGQGQVVGLTLVGGTSVAAPAMAGILALVEQKNGAYQGQANYTLYKLAQTDSCDSSQQTNPTAQNSCVFYDVTRGSNMVPCAGGSAGCSSPLAGQNGFMSGNAAGPGYDLATGLGSINAANLANNWKNAALAGSTTNFQASTASFVHGTPVTISGTVAAASGNGAPTGSVALLTDLPGSTADAIAVGNGAFTANVLDLPGGQYNVVARYGGDATFSASESPAIRLDVTAEASTTSFVNPPGGGIGYGSPLALRIRVAGFSGAGNASGMVTLQDGAAPVGSYPLTADGSAYIPTGSGSAYSFATGTHSLVATYSGDNSFLGSNSAAVGFTVVKSSPFVVVGLNTANVDAGNAVSARAVVSGLGSAPATGMVQFTVDGTAVGSSLPLQAVGFFGTQAQAAELLPALAAGTHTIGANYNAGSDANYLSVASGDPANEFTQTVTVNASSGNKSKTATALSVTTAPVSLGDTGTFTVTVSPGTATGTVTLWDLVGPRSSAAMITGGAASITIPWTQAGKTTLYAVYSGDAGNAASASAGVAMNVSQGVPAVGLAAPAATGINQQVSLNATVAGKPGNTLLSYPTGIVEFWDSVNGAPAQLLTAQTLTVGAGNIGVYGLRAKFAAGTHVLHAHYRGDNNWQSQDSANVTLTAADFTLSIGPGPVAITAGNPASATLTLTPAGGFTGTVTLACGTVLPAGYSCGFSPASVTMNGNAATTTTVTFTPQMATAAAAATVKSGSIAWWGAGLGLGLLAWGLVLANKKRPRVWRELAFASACALCVACVLMGCGGGGTGGTVGPVASTTTLATSNARVAFESPLTLTVNVSAAVTPTGTVQLTDNGQAFGNPVSLAGGTASFAGTALPIGLHGMMAHYAGSTAVLGSTSAPVRQAITGSLPVEITATSGTLAHALEVTVLIN